VAVARPFAPAPRGRHAPPLEVRQDRQRQRLFDAAARVFARSGYAEATAEGIAREAGMSKATFYEHFENKEDCIVALADTATELVVQMLAEGREAAGAGDYRDRVRASVAAYLHVLRTFPDHARTLLVEIVGAGARAQERRDRMLGELAEYLVDLNARDAAVGRVKRLASPYDAYAIVGATAELSSRALRAGDPDPDVLVPVLERVVFGLIDQGVHAGNR
jgi:AcrR family transcriptional regulator